MVKFKLMSARQQTPLSNAPFHTWVLPDDAIWTSFHRLEADYLLRFPELADFHVSADGSVVTCHPMPGVSEDTWQHLYFNQVLPLAMSMRGKLVFHGSAVEIGGAAVAFVAESGRGKSTLAASFATKNFRFLTDDGLALEPGNTEYQVLPSHPSIRLWSDSEAALILPGAETLPALSFTSKSRFLAGPEICFCNEPRPLRKVYFLGEGNCKGVDITPMTGAESLIEWVKHSFLLDIEKRSLLIFHFEAVAKLANKKIHYRLDYPRSYEKLTDIRQSIVAHINENMAAHNR